MTVLRFDPKKARRTARRLRLVDEKYAQAANVNAEVRELLIHNKQPERELVKEVQMFEPLYPQSESARARVPLWLKCLGAAAAGIATALLLIGALA